MKQVSTENRPDCISFVHWRFSRKDVAGWISHAAARTSLPDLSLEGYIQSESIDLYRLHRWLQDARWSRVGEKFPQNTVYKQFCMANAAFEYCQDGTPALARGGRPAKMHALAPSPAPSLPPPPTPPTPPAGAGGRQVDHSNVALHALCAPIFSPSGPALQRCAYPRTHN